jgi:hypothetical protein
MKIELTLEQYNKIHRLLDFANWYIDEHKGGSGLEENIEQWESDKEDFDWAKEVFQEIDARIGVNNG